jgi:hypothetical protein
MSNDRNSPLRAAIAIAIAMLTLILTAGIASAHAKKTVGPYAVFIGFVNEPAIVEQPNAVDVLVRNGDSEDAAPVTGLGDALKADVKFGNQTMTVNLEESDENPGEYTGSFIPTAQGAYTFRVYGAINGTNVDESVTSGPDTFSEVDSSSSLEFPSKVPPVASVAQTANDASDTADSARTLGIIGIVVGALGLIAGVIGMLMARSSQAKISSSPVITDREENPGTTARS